MEIPKNPKCPGTKQVIGFLLGQSTGTLKIPSPNLDFRIVQVPS